jgi:Fe-S-cluster containining protein
MLLATPFRKALLELKKRPPQDLDLMVQKIHEDVFAKTDCSACALCCKGISPILYQHDILRLAKGLKMKREKFAENYLDIDKDNDYIFKSTPCPFLGIDNQCTVYDDRPTACRDYPHTDRRRFYQLIELSIKNAEYCPAVREILEKLVVDSTLPLFTFNVPYYINVVLFSDFSYEGVSYDQSRVCGMARYGGLGSHGTHESRGRF